MKELELQTLFFKCIHSLHKAHHPKLQCFSRFHKKNCCSALIILYWSFNTQAQTTQKKSFQNLNGYSYIGNNCYTSMHQSSSYPKRFSPQLGQNVNPICLHTSWIIIYLQVYRFKDVSLGCTKFVKPKLNFAQILLLEENPGLKCFLREPELCKLQLYVMCRCCAFKLMGLGMHSSGQHAMWRIAFPCGACTWTRGGVMVSCHLVCHLLASCPI